MADNGKIEFGEDFLDDLDFGDLDYGDPFQNDGKKKKSRTPVDEFKNSALGGIKSGLNAGMLRRLIIAALPKGYGQAFTAYDAIDSGLADVMKDNASDLSPYLLKMKREADKMSPALKRLLPKSVRDAMDEADYANSSSSAPSSPDKLSGDLAGLDKLFAAQTQDTIQTSFRDAVKETRDQKRFVADMTVQTDIGRGIGRLVGYQDNILINYHRKSLEIGYRQLDVGVRLLKLQQKHFADSDRAMADIVKNTSLPDYLKMHHTDLVKQQLSSKLTGAAMNSVGNWAGNYFKNMRENASGIVGGALTFKDQIDTGAAMAGSRAHAFGGMLGGMAGQAGSGAVDQILRYVVSKVAPNIAKNPHIKRGDNILRGLFTGLAQKLNEYAKSETKEEGWKRTAHEGIKTVLDTYSPTTSIAGKRLTDLDKPAMFDNLFHKSVTEIMPGYLASIDKWIRVMATGTDQEETAYSHYTGGLVKKSTLNEQHVRIGLKDNNGDSLRREVDGLLRDLNAQDLSLDAKRVLRRQLMRDLAGAHSFKPTRYVKAATWAKDPEPIAKELIDFFAEHFNLDAEGKDKTPATEEMKSKVNDLNETFTDIQKRNPDYGDRMAKLSAVMGRKAFRELGLSKFNGTNGDTIQMDKLYDLLVNSGDQFDPADKKEKLKPMDIPGFNKDAWKSAADKLANEAWEKKEKEKAKKKAAELLAAGFSGEAEDGEHGGGGGGWVPPVAAPNANPRSTMNPRITVRGAKAAPIIFPELMMTSDIETHLRLDQLIKNGGMGLELLDLIAKMIPHAGTAPHDPNAPAGSPQVAVNTPGAVGSMTARLKAKWDKFSYFNAAVGGGKKVVKGLGSYLRTSYGLLGRAMWGTAKAVPTVASLPFKSIHGLGVSDICLRGSSDPVMLARDIRRERYIDTNTKKVIRKLKDITGEVKDVTGEVVITAEEFANGLYNGEGESLAGYMGRAAASLTGWAAGAGASYLGATYGAMWKVAKKVGEIALDQLTQVDAYFPGEDKPRIRSTLMKQGFYRDAKGSPIMSLKDITGSVFDINGNEVVSEEEMVRYKSFYTRKGSLLFTLGRGMVSLGAHAIRIGTNAAIWYGKQVGKMYRGMWRAAGAVGRGIGNLGKRAFGRGNGIGMLNEEMAHAAIEIQGEQLNTQKAILALLRSKFAGPVSNPEDTDGDGVRDYSWKDILHRRASQIHGGVAAAVGGGDSAAVVDAITKMNKDLDGKMTDLKDQTEKSGEESWLDEARDIKDIFSSNKNGPGGPGRLKRGWGYLKKKGGKLIDNKYVDGAAGWAAKKAAPWLLRGGAAAATAIGGEAALGAATGAGAAGAAGGIAAGAEVAGGMAGAAEIAGGAAVAGEAVAGATAGAGVMGAVGTGLATTGAAIGGLLSLPVLAVGATAGSVGYLGYRISKAHDAGKFPLLCLRMTQYGVSPVDNARVSTLLQLEALVKDSVTIGKDGTATMSATGIPMPAIFKLFAINDNSRIANFSKWIQNRFRPVYLAHCVAMNRIRGTTELESADTGIGDGDIDTYLSIVDIGDMGDAYQDHEASPFDNDLVTDAFDVQVAVKFVRDKRKQVKDDKKEAVVEGATTGNASKAAVNTTLGVSAKGSDDPAGIAKDIKVSNLAGVRSYSSAAYVSAAAADASSKLSALDIPTAVRFKAYGLKEMNLARCTQLQSVEEIFWPFVNYLGAGQAVLSGDPEARMAKVTAIFQPVDAAKLENMKIWLRDRFTPVFLQYCISCRKRYNGDAKEAAKNLTGPAMKEVLTETCRAVTSNMYGDTPIWLSFPSPWYPDSLEKNAGSVSLYINGLDTGDTSKVLAVTGAEAETQARTAPNNNDYGKNLTDVALGNQKSTPTGTGVGNNNQTMANYGKIYGSGAVAGGAVGQSTTGAGTGVLLMNGKLGSNVQHPGGGSGGDINAIPEGSGKGAAAMGPIVMAAAKMVGFDPAMAMKVVGTESNFDPSVDNGTACGLFQFTKGTWSDMMRDYGSTYGIAPGTPRTDARANAILGVCYLKQNYEGLQKSLGGEVTDLDLYMAHFLGLGGAKRFLSAPRGDDSTKHVAENVPGNNASIFYENYKSPNKRTRTVSEVLVEMQKRMGIGLKKAGLDADGGVPSAAPATASGSGEGKDEGGVEGGSSAAVAAAAVATPSAAASAASGGASGSPSAAMPMDAATAATINAPIPGGEGPPVTGAVDAPVSATRASAAAAIRTDVADQAATADQIAPLLQKQLDVQIESRDILKLIREGLANGGSATPPTDQAGQGKVAQEPMIRNPIQTKRPNAVT